MSDQDLLPPGIDPRKAAIGIRKVVARNEASTRVRTSADWGAAPRRASMEVTVRSWIPQGTMAPK